MTGYIKGGVVTRIKPLTKNKKTKEYIEEYFDKNLYKKMDNEYLIKENEFQENIKKFRNELLKITKNKADSIENSEAYLLETTGEKLLSKKIYLKNNNKKYCFEDYKKIMFETDNIEIKEDEIHIILSVITIIWNIDKIEIEDVKFFSNFINILIRKSVTNTLKNSSWFTITY